MKTIKSKLLTVVIASMVFTASAKDASTKAQKARLKAKHAAEMREMRKQVFYNGLPVNGNQNKGQKNRAPRNSRKACITNIGAQNEQRSVRSSNGQTTITGDVIVFCDK